MLPAEILVAGAALGGMALIIGFALKLSVDRTVDRPEASDSPQDAGPRERLLVDVRADQESDLRRELGQAGFSHPAATFLYTGLKLLCGFVATFAAALLAQQFLAEQSAVGRYSLLAPAFALGFLIPKYFLHRRRSAYSTRIERAVPDTVDLLKICVDAGQSLDHAIRRAARELATVHPEFSSHLAWASEAIAAGLDREEALLRISRETGNDDIRLLALTIAQAARLGTPVSNTLRVFSDDLRDRRIRKVEERTNVLPTKMTLGTMVFTVPPLLILLLTPAITRIMEIF